MTTTTLPSERRPGRPRKTEPVIVESTPDQEQPQQPEPTPQPAPVQYTIAKLTAHMLAGEIHRLAQEGEDLTPVHQVSDAIRAVNAPVQGLFADPPSTEQPAPHVEQHRVDALKAAVDAAKSSPDKPRTFAVAHYSKRGALRLSHGVEYEDGDIAIHDGHGFAGTYADDMNELHETAQKRYGNAYHVDYTD